MNTQSNSNVINLESSAAKRFASTAKELPLLALSHEELRQLLSNQLQSTLDVQDILMMFFKISQRMISYDSLTYKHESQSVAVELGVLQKHRVAYNLNYQGEYLGNIVFSRGRSFTEQELGDFESIIASLIFPLRNGLLYAAALQSALKDPLTGAGNRISMQQTLQRDIDTAQRHKQPLSVLMIDIDYFKRINDCYGHSAGDLVLVEIAQAIQMQLRSTDALFRYGGEEFLAVLPNTCEADALVVAERLRASLAALLINFAEEEISITASLGCATLGPDDSLSSLLQRSDVALYAAKRKGRNQVQVAP